VFLALQTFALRTYYELAFQKIKEICKVHLACGKHMTHWGIHMGNRIMGMAQRQAEARAAAKWRSRRAAHRSG